MRDWSQDEIKAKITKGLYNLHLSFNRPSSEKAIDARAENLVPIFETWEAKKVEKFFEWARLNLEKLPSDSEIKYTSQQQSDAMDRNEVAGGYYYSVSGVKIPQGTFCTIGSATTAEWHLLPSKAKELSVKAFYNKLVGVEMQEWAQICEQKFPVRKGKVQKPREEWNDEEKQIFEQYLDWYEKDVKRWEEYRKSLS